jgi:hypothetical protein
VQRHKSAIYLVGHGPYREPRLIDLQHLRVLRYRQALCELSGDDYDLGEVFVDVNYPRASPQVEKAFHAFDRVLEKVRSHEYECVFIDLQVGTSFEPMAFKFVPNELQRAGARVLNAFEDDGGAIAARLAQEYGESARHLRSDLTDANDLVALFPALAGRVTQEALFRKFLSKPDSNPPFWSEERDLETLLNERPRATSKLPLLSTWRNFAACEERVKREEEEAARRREGELLYKLGPQHEGVLCPEPGERSARWRDAERLKWAEDRLRQLGFAKLFEGLLVSYQRKRGGRCLFADPRHEGALIFYSYPCDQQARAGERTKLGAPAARIQDSWVRDLEKKLVQQLERRR